MIVGYPAAQLFHIVIVSGGPYPLRCRLSGCFRFWYCRLPVFFHGYPLPHLAACHIPFALVGEACRILDQLSDSRSIVGFSISCRILDHRLLHNECLHICRLSGCPISDIPSPALLSGLRWRRPTFMASGGSYPLYLPSLRLSVHLPSLRLSSPG